MNKEYTYKDGKVIIKDYDDNEREVDYFDNLNKVLVHENIIETMEILINDLEKAMEAFKDYDDNPLSISTSLVLGFTFPCIVKSIDGINTTSINDLNNGELYAILLLPILPIMAASSIALSNYKTLRKKKGCISQLTFLKKELEVEKKYVDKLKKPSLKNNKCIENKTIMVDDKLQLEGLKNCLKLYYNLGYDYKKYDEHYKKKTLDKILKPPFIELVNDYFEKKKEL